MPLETLDIISRKDCTTRITVAEKRKLSQELFERLFIDGNALVRHVIAGNRKTPIPILEKLVSDTDKNVARLACKNLDKRRVPKMQRAVGVEQVSPDPTFCKCCTRTRSEIINLC